MFTKIHLHLENVASHFPSTRLTYKTQQNFDMKKKVFVSCDSVCQPNQMIYSTFIYGKIKKSPY